MSGDHIGKKEFNTPAPQPELSKCCGAKIEPCDCKYNCRTLRCTKCKTYKGCLPPEPEKEEGIIKKTINEWKKQASDLFETHEISQGKEEGEHRCYGSKIRDGKFHCDICDTEFPPDMEVPAGYKPEEEYEKLIKYIRNLILKERQLAQYEERQFCNEHREKARQDAFKECIEILEAEKQRLIKWGVKDLNPIIVFTDLISSLSQKSHE